MAVVKRMFVGGPLHGQVVEVDDDVKEVAIDIGPVATIDDLKIRAVRQVYQLMRPGGSRLLVFAWNSEPDVKQAISALAELAGLPLG